MCGRIDEIGILTRREIEARIVGPLIRAFIGEIGETTTFAVVNRVIRLLAKESGAQLAKKMGGNSMYDLAKGIDLWARGGLLDMDILDLSDTRYFFNVKRCAYAEMYKKLDMDDLGTILSCGRDFQLVRGFNPRMKLVRTKTIMQEHSHCDFRITLE